MGISILGLKEYNLLCSQVKKKPNWTQLYLHVQNIYINQFNKNMIYVSVNLLLVQFS